MNEIEKADYEERQSAMNDKQSVSELDRQVGGDHYKKLLAYQPWLVLQACMTPEEFRGYMKGTAIVYFMREGDKGGDEDIAKGVHTLSAYLEMNGVKK